VVVGSHSQGLEVEGPAGSRSSGAWDMAKLGQPPKPERCKVRRYVRIVSVLLLWRGTVSSTVITLARVSRHIRTGRQQQDRA
jgi:hypothetical protein